MCFSQYSDCSWCHGMYLGSGSPFKPDEPTITRFKDHVLLQIEDRLHENTNDRSDKGRDPGTSREL